VAVLVAGAVLTASSSVAVERPSTSTTSTPATALTASNGAADDQFGGYAEAVSGHTLVVGDPPHTVNHPFQGEAYVYSDTSGSWQQVAELTANDGAQGDWFGKSVAVSGTTIVVGAPFHDDVATSTTGVMYVFSDAAVAGTWVQTAEFEDASTVDAGLGSSVAISGSTIIAGVPSTVGANVDQGAAYVFTETAGTWSQTARLTANDGDLDEFFGTSVAISGGTIVVGAHDHRVGDAGVGEGAVYVFTGAGSNWPQTGELLANDAVTGDQLGTAVAISGSTIVAGAPFREVGTNTEQGALYVFTPHNSGGWSQTAELTAADGTQNDMLGTYLALSGTTIVAGVPSRTVGANQSQGAAYVFSNTTGNNWPQTAELTAGDGAAGDLLGRSVTLSGTTVFAGAPEHTVGSNVFQGTVYVFGGPAVSVGLTPTVPAGGLGIGDSLTVPVTVTAGAAALTSASLSDLTVGGSAVKVTKSPTGTSGFALAANASKTFQYQVTATKAGTATLSTTVTAQVSGGGTVTASASKSFPVSSRALTVTAVAQPGTVTLAVDGKGQLVPKTLTVRVRLTNTSTAKLTHVNLMSLGPVPADLTQPLDKLAFPKGSLPLKVASIEGKASFVKTLKLKVTGDGTYVFRYLATYDDPAQAGGNGKTAGQTGRFTVDIPLLYLNASLDKRDVRDDGGQLTIAGGNPWYVSGDVHNLSSFQTVCLLPLAGGFGGNAAGLGPHQIGVASVDGASPPMAGVIKPGDTSPFLMRVNTDPDAGPRSTVDLKPEATLGDPGDTCNVLSTEQRPKLAAAKIARAKDSGPFDVHVTPNPDHSGDAGVFDFFGEYAKGSAASYAEALEETLVLAQKYATYDALKRGIQNVADVPRRLGEAVNSLDKTATLISTFWTYASAEEKQQLLDSVYNDFVDKTHEVWDGVQAQVQKAASGWFDGVVAAWYSGSTSQLLLALRGAGASGHGINSLAISMAKFEVGLAVISKGAELTKTFVSVAGRSAVYARLSEVPAGALLSLDEMTRLWGLSKEDWEAYRKIAAEEKVIIGVRGRAPISVKNVDEGAVWKHENLKPKNVNDIDINYLGFAAEDNGLVALRTYTPAQRESILANIHSADLTNAQKNVLLKRAMVRFNERDYLPKIQKFAKDGEIDVGINYQDNGIDRESTSDLRKFALDRQKIKGGGTYYRPLQENPSLDALAKSGGKLPEWCKDVGGSALCRVTGDMDGVYIAAPDGTSLSVAKRLAVYDKLIAAGWQHPETLTWLLNPETFYFESKASILSGLELGGDPMIEFGLDPNKQFATYLDLKKSVLLDTDLFYLNIIGGTSAR
jgi:FG-GAP repeat